MICIFSKQRWFGIWYSIYSIISLTLSGVGRESVPGMIECLLLSPQLCLKADLNNSNVEPTVEIASLMIISVTNNVGRCMNVLTGAATPGLAAVGASGDTNHFSVEGQIIRNSCRRERVRIEVIQITSY